MHPLCAIQIGGVPPPYQQGWGTLPGQHPPQGESPGIFSVGKGDMPRGLIL